MPDGSICIHCRKPIDTHGDDYVMINKDPDQYDTPSFYAHRQCQAEVTCHARMLRFADPHEDGESRSAALMLLAGFGVFTPLVAG